MMRDLLHNATADARDFLSGVVGEMRADNRLSDDEVLREYEQMRGNPEALISFAQQRVPAGDDPTQEALRYEAEMEALMRQRGGR